MINKTRKILDNKQFMRIFSIVLAILCWLLVATTDPASKTVPLTVRNVPVNLELQTGALAKLGLNIIHSDTPQYVDVAIVGQRTTVGQITAMDLPTTVNVANITEPGTYELALTYAGSSNNEAFEVKSYLPRSVLVRFDRIIPKTFPVKHIVNGMAAAPMEGFVLGTEYTTPSSVTVTGPQADIDKIKECLVQVELTNPLEKTYSKLVPIVLLDAKGEEIVPEKNNLTLDKTEVELFIPVLSKTGLPLTVGFTNVPKNFPLWELEGYMSISPDYIELAVPADILSNVSEIQLGYIDIREILIGDNNYNFDVILPSPSEQIVRIDNIARSDVSFDDSTWDSASFHVKNIVLLNKPTKYNVTLGASTIYDVEFVGDMDIISGMTADDIIAEIDLSDRVLSPGSFELTAEISAPTKGLVWATGVHSVVVHVSEK